MLTRRHFIQTTTALFSVTGPGMAFADTWPTEAQKAEWDAQVTPQDYVAETSNPWGLHPRFLPQRVVAKAGLVPGDIHVDAVARYLYHIEEGGTAMRYGVAIARGNLYEPGVYTIKRKVRLGVCLVLKTLSRDIFITLGFLMIAQRVLDVRQMRLYCGLCCGGITCL